MTDRRFGPAPLPLRWEVPSVRALRRLCVDLLSLMHHFQFCARAGRAGLLRSAALRATSLLSPQLIRETFCTRRAPLAAPTSFLRSRVSRETLNRPWRAPRNESEVAVPG